MQLTSHRPVLITHMDGGVPFVTSAVIVAQGNADNIHDINLFLDSVKNSIENKLFCMDDEDVEIDTNLTLTSDYVSIDGCCADLQKISRVRATSEHGYSCICCSVEEFYNSYSHVPQPRNFEFEIVPQDTEEELWLEGERPFGDKPLAMVQVPVIEIRRNGVWRAGVLITDAIKLDRCSLVINHSKGKAIAGGHRCYVINVADEPHCFDFSSLSPFFTEFGMFRNVVLSK